MLVEVKGTLWQAAFVIELLRLEVLFGHSQSDFMHENCISDIRLLVQTMKL